MSYRRTGALHEHRDREREGMRVATSSWMDPGANAQKPRVTVYFRFDSFRAAPDPARGAPAAPHVSRTFAGPGRSCFEGTIYEAL